MSANDSGLTVRPQWPRGSRWLLYLAVFLVTGLGIYRAGLATAGADRKTKRHTAIATIHLHDGLQTAARPEEIERQVASEEMVRRALGRLGSTAGQAPDEQRHPVAGAVVEAIRRDLRVSTDGTSIPGELDVAVRYTGSAAQRPDQLVNAVAESYADDYRTQWSRRTYRAYAEAHEAAQHAEQQSLDARTRLEDHFQRHYSLLQAEQDAPTLDAAGQTAVGQTNGGSTAPAELTVSDSGNPAAEAEPQRPWVDNPEWIELSERLAELQRRRNELLIDRKPVHPEVRDTELRIAAVEEQLLTIPRKVVGEPSAVASSVASPELGETPSGPTELERAEAALAWNALKESADQAAEAYLQSLRLERHAWQEHQRQPQIELKLAQPILGRSSPAVADLTLLVAALGMGFVLAIGVGMVSEGAAIEPALSCVDQVRAALPVEIVGSIPDTAPVGRSQAAENRRSILRWILIGGGLLVIAACVGLLLRQWAG